MGLQNKLATCTASSSNNAITLSNFITASTAPNYVMSFSLVNSIKYPGSKFVSGVVTITLLDSNGNTVNTGSYTFVK